MKPALHNHYLIQTKRNLIHPCTNTGQFIENISNQFDELLNAYADSIDYNQIPSNALMVEATDLLLVITDMAEHYKVDLLELIRNRNRDAY